MTVPQLCPSSLVIIPMNFHLAPDNMFQRNTLGYSASDLVLLAELQEKF